MRKQFVVLNNMFKYSVYPKRLLRENPMQYIKRRKKEKSVSLFDEDTETKVETISNEEYQKLAVHLSQHETDSYLLLPVQIAYHTGLRAGEVCGLTWQDINLEEQYLRVRRSMYYDTENKCWELKVPKNTKERIVDFGDSLARILKNAKKAMKEEQLRYGSLYQKHYYQTREIMGRLHYQIFTEISSDVDTLSSRSTKGKFIEDRDLTQPLNPLLFVCSKPGGELLTTQTLKWCNN